MRQPGANERDQPTPTGSPSLPLPPTPLVGREREVAAVAALLVRPDVRVLTLIGPPGIGKTRLGLQVAAHLLAAPAAGAQPAFPDGVCFVPLAPITDPALVLVAIAQALEAPGSATGPLLESVQRALHSQQMLLFLDNFEQVVAAGPGLMDLLAACPGVTLLVTSRELLHVYGEQRTPCRPCPCPIRRGSPVATRSQSTTRSRYSCSALRPSRPGFALAERDVRPLPKFACAWTASRAIELAAARILALPPADLLARLDSRLKLLTGGGRNVPERQRTLRRTLEWSHNLLDPAEQILFRRLGVFVGGATLDGIERVCGPDIGRQSA